MDRRIMFVVAGVVILLAGGCANTTPRNPFALDGTHKRDVLPPEPRILEFSGLALAEPSCQSPSLSVFDHGNFSLDDGASMAVAVQAHVEAIGYPGGELVQVDPEWGSDSEATVVLLGGSNGSDRLLRIDLFNVASPPLAQGWLVRATYACPPEAFAVMNRSCGDQIVRAEFAEPFELWQASDIDNYTVTYTRSGYRLGPETVKVWGGQPVESRSLQPFPVCSLFSILDRADFVGDVTFDPVLGYPTAMSVDPFESRAGDEFDLTVTAFSR